MLQQGINLSILVGTVHGPVTYTERPNGDASATLTLVTRETWLDRRAKGSGKMSSAEEHELVFRGRLAQIVHKRVADGSVIYAQGPRRARRGAAKAAFEVRVDRLEIILDAAGQPPGFTVLELMESAVD